MKGFLALSLTFVLVLAAELFRGGALTPVVELYAPDQGPATAAGARPPLTIDLYDPVEEYLAEVEAAEAARSGDVDPTRAVRVSAGPSDLIRPSGLPGRRAVRA